MKKLLFLSLFIMQFFFSCDKNNVNDDPIPRVDTLPSDTVFVDTTTVDTMSNVGIYVVSDSTAEYNVLFYANFCVNCPDAHFDLYVDDIFMGEIGGCFLESECSCDSNSNSGLHTMITPGRHTYRAIPYCKDSKEETWYLEDSFDVPRNDCIAVFVSRNNEKTVVYNDNCLPDIPYLVTDTTAEYNVLFYANFCVDCPDAHYDLYVDGIFISAIGGCWMENECSCDSNSNYGIHTMMTSGKHTYQAIPYCEDYKDENWYLEDSFDVPENDCMAVFVSPDKSGTMVNVQKNE